MTKLAKISSPSAPDGRGPKGVSCEDRADILILKPDVEASETLPKPDSMVRLEPEALATAQDTLFRDCTMYRRAFFLRHFELPLLLLAGLAPALAVWSLLDRTMFTGAFSQTAAAIVIAIGLSWFVLARLRDHANARLLSYVLPVNIGAFLGVISTMALLRIPYSGSLLASGAVCAVGASFLLAVYRRRLVKRHVIVGGGRASEITLNGNFVPAPSLNDLEEFVQQGWRDWALVADLHYPHAERTERLFAKAALSGIPVYHFRQVAEMQSGQVKISHLSENELGSLIPDASYTFMKRAIDVTAAVCLLPLLLPLFALLALAIRLDSSGSAFFIQERVGFRGRKFSMIKFRTMRERNVSDDAEAKREDAMTRSDDDRITRIGAFLRKTRMDELPQILNVLRGDMSFIGPRPEASALSQWYEAELPFYSYRHIVRPGITGWAQVNQGHVTDVNDVLSKLRYDFYYIKNFSLWLDLLVGLKTLRVIATGIGAK
ncbi:MAG: exopolysaccharide biosynthesis polyprenyl glycosylphosphotransferase [Erythrobacter sp.]|uniref:exopolysaccharide biosynthesis polyprenyl glycosylphosphotransferase n=1 Tax=Erythrobacter sp. TaxID=1042 RepID=UPI003A869113